MRIVVTGSSGKLGSVVVQDLMAAGHEVVPIDVRPPSHSPGPQTHVVDLARVDLLIPLLRGADAICHLGNWPSIQQFPLTNGFVNNIGSTHAVFEAALSVSIRKVVYASSIQSYGILPASWQSAIPHSKPRYLPIDEEHPLLPTDAYPLSKAMGEWAAEAFCRQEPRLQAFSLRFTYISAPRPDMPAKPRLPKGRTGVGGDLFTYVHVRDAARACRLACEADRRGHTPLNIIAQRSSEPWEKDWIQAFYGIPLEFRGELGPNDPLFVPDRALEVLGFRADLPR